MRRKNRKNTAVLSLILAVCLLTSCGGARSRLAAGGDDGYFDMEFHAGGRDARPENTLYAYQYALENGAMTIECDMQMTKDGVLVMSHNAVLNPDITTDADGNIVQPNTLYIHDMTLEEVKQYNVGRTYDTSLYHSVHGETLVQTDAAIPTMREFFNLVRDSGRDDVRLNIEAKYYTDPELGVLCEKNPDKDELLNAFLEVVREYDFTDRVMLQSFDWDLLVRMEKLAPEIETVALYSTDHEWERLQASTFMLAGESSGANPDLANFLDISDEEAGEHADEEAGEQTGGVRYFGNNPIKIAYALGIDNVSPHYDELSKGRVALAHKLGMKVIPWTVNDRDIMEWLYYIGVDGIITDKPWVLREFLESVGEDVAPVINLDLPYHLEPDHY